MGSGIAQVCASKGMSVILSDRTRDALDHGLAAIKRSLGRFVKKGSLSAEQAEQTAARIRLQPGLEAMAEADFVVEAVTEQYDVKRKVFEELDRRTAIHAILASNTSSISITRLAAATAKPHRVVGFHFMNPVPIMRLIEVTRGAHTSAATFESAKGLAEALGKVTVVSQDRPVSGGGLGGGWGWVVVSSF
jgi:3-hydroxybutyryl-CoA dehydrogenase